MLIGSVIFLAEALIFESPMIRYIDWKILTAMFYQTVIAAAFGYLLWNYMLSQHGAIAMHSFVFIMPISSVFFSGLLLGEPITIYIIISLVLITAGIWLLHFRGENSDK